MRIGGKRNATPFWVLSCVMCTAFTPSASVVAANYAVIVAGLGGEPQYEQRFGEQADEIAAAAAMLAERPEQVVKLAGAQVTRDSIRKELEALANSLEERDTITIVLLGHGTFDGEEYRFNIPGPDITGSELGALFGKLRAQQQLIVNATSASGATIEKWARPGRVLITATKSGGERTATRFARYWAEALKSGNADLNKDEIVTAAEAFAYASRQVEAAFKSELALATEHPRVDNEDAAQQVVVARLGSSAVLSSDPRINALLTKRTALERELEDIKARRSSLNEDAYYDALEALLVEFALLQRQIDERQASTRAVES